MKSKSRKDRIKAKAKAERDAMDSARPSVVNRVEHSDFERMKRNFLNTFQSSIADQFEALVIRAQMSGQGFELQERVDGGKGYYEIPDHVIDCQNKLGKAAIHLGAFDYALLHSFIAEGRTADAIAANFGEQGTRAELYYRRRFREALEALGEYWAPQRRSRNRQYFFREAFKVIAGEPAAEFAT